MSVDNRGTTDVPRWYYSFMIRGVRYFGSIPEARTKAEALKVEAMKRLEVYEGRYGKEPGVKDFCEFVDQVYMDYAKNNKATWKHDLFKSETLRGILERCVFGISHQGRSRNSFSAGSTATAVANQSAVLSVFTRNSVFSHRSSTWQCGKKLLRVIHV